MSRIILLSLVSIASCLLGCAPDRRQYIKNWDHLRVGMTKDEVRTLLGDCSESVGPVKVEWSSASSQPQPDLLLSQALANALFDGDYERWHYGQFELAENLMKPADKAYVVYFDNDGRVVKWRKPAPGQASHPIAEEACAEVVASYRLPESDWIGPANEAYRAAVVVPPCAYALSRTGRLYVYEIPSDGSAPAGTPVEIIQHAGDGNDLEFVDEHLVFTDNGGLRVFSVADRRHPKQVAEVALATPAHSQTLARGGTRLFVIGFGQISCFDMRDVWSPRLLFEHKADRDWWTGCVLGNRLYVGEIAVGCSAPAARQRAGIDVLTIRDTGLKEMAFLPTPGPYHLFEVDDTHLLACVDAESLVHTGPGPYGRSLVIDVSDPVHPLADEILSARGGRVAAMANRQNGRLLLCEGAAFRIQDLRWVAQQTFPTCGSTLDGAPYHAKFNGRWAALPMDHELMVLRVRDDVGAAARPSSRPGATIAPGAPD